MKKQIIVSIAALLLNAGSISAHPFHYFQQGNTKEVVRDKREVHQDNREVRGDRRELAKDRGQRNTALANGHNGAAAVKQHEVNKDKRELHRDKRDRREDRRDLHQDIKK